MYVVVWTSSWLTGLTVSCTCASLWALREQKPPLTSLWLLGRTERVLAECRLNRTDVLTLTREWGRPDVASPILQLSWLSESPTAAEDVESRHCARVSCLQAPTAPGRARTIDRVNRKAGPADARPLRPGPGRAPLPAAQGGIDP